MGSNDGAQAVLFAAKLIDHSHSDTRKPVTAETYWICPDLLAKVRIVSPLCLSVRSWQWYGMSLPLANQVGSELTSSGSEQYPFRGIRAVSLSSHKEAFSFQRIASVQSFRCVVPLYEFFVGLITSI